MAILIILLVMQRLFCSSDCCPRIQKSWLPGLLAAMLGILAARTLSCALLTAFWVSSLFVLSQLSVDFIVAFAQLFYPEISNAIGKASTKEFYDCAAMPIYTLWLLLYGCWLGRKLVDASIRNLADIARQRQLAANSEMLPTLSQQTQQLINVLFRTTLRRGPQREETPSVELSPPSITRQEVSLEQTDASRECSICCTGLANTMMRPCMHSSLCETCLLNLLERDNSGVLRCPVCRSDVEAYDVAPDGQCFPHSFISVPISVKNGACNV